jgi:molybdopterin-containing oxidoreductase family iron-sulfur binding subunit
VVCPEPHFLECFDDAEPVEGLCCLRQPTAPSLFAARTLRASLLSWSLSPQGERESLQDAWREEVYPRSTRELPFESFFEQALERGWVEVEVPASPPWSFRPGAVKWGAEAAAGAPLTLVLHPTIGMGDGRHAHNPWLQELPDPVTKVAWGHALSLAPRTAEELSLRDGDLVALVAEGADDPLPPPPLTLPVHVQPGQHPSVVAVALGYGRLGTERFAAVGPKWLEARREHGRVGQNAAPWIVLRGPSLHYDVRPVRLEKTGAHRALACTQDHHSLRVPEHLAPRGGEVREAVLATTLARWTERPEAVVPRHPGAPADLWPPSPPASGLQWGMVIDLSRCTGCSACVIACQAENNVPVVGADEVRRHREMHWIRIDRYYEGDDSEVRAVHQPMLCQHCDRAPCETVCPVLATVHSSEGLNQQVYNRCVGTRYCANNCPYKTRRFNWFDYARDDALANLALNPDVTVRSRGVMEKCSFCVQRILEAKAEAHREGRTLRDGDVRAACEQSCPARAITFGNLNDPQSAVAKQRQSPRTYAVLEELNLRPAVHYQAVVRHRLDDEGPSHG